MSDPTIIIDGHLDIAMHYVGYGRRFEEGSWVKRKREAKPVYPFDGVGVATVGLPDLLLGRTGIVMASLWAAPHGSPHCPEAVYYETPRQAYQVALRQIDYYHRLADENPRIRLIRQQNELEAVLGTWGADSDLTQHQLGIVIQMEGADPILEPRQAEEWYERGVRIIAPAWHATRYSAGTGGAGRLTKLGYELLEMMSSLGMILDVSHLAHAAFHDALDHYDGVIIATHSNPAHFVNSDRQLTDDMIRQLAERDGVMGVVPFNEFLIEGWKSWTGRKHEGTVSLVLDVIDHICQVTGTSRHVGIGTDWDGGFGWESIPLPFDSHIDLWQMGAYLKKRGYGEEDIHAILCGNFLRQLRAGLP